MTKNTYRFIILLLTGLLIFVIWWGVSFSRNNSEIVELPQVIEDIYPLPNDQVPQQSSIIVDVPVGYEIVLIVDNYIFLCNCWFLEKKIKQEDDKVSNENGCVTTDFKENKVVLVFEKIF